MNPLEELVRRYVPLGSESAKGFHTVKCAICNDYKSRGGFRFDGSDIGYNCFNCGYKALFEETSGKLSRKMRNVLTSFDIPEDEIDRALGKNFIHGRQEESKREITLKDIKSVSLSTPTIPLPPNSVPLADVVDTEQGHSILEYIESRGLTLHSHPWYISEKMPNRVIIPYFRNGRIIFWQARIISSAVTDTPAGKKIRRYLNCEAPRSNVIFGYDNLYSYSKKPLFITEGVFDALLVDGICTLGSTLTPEHLEIIKKTRRRVIFVIDKDKTGKNMALAAIEHGWEITFPPNGSEDVNDSMKKFGRLYTIWSLITNVSTGIKARTQVALKCKG